MLTNEQALEIIKQHDECYVVWAIDQDRIVAVHPIPREATAADRFHVLMTMKTDYDGPTKGRFLSSATTTLQTLIDESKETKRIARRVEIFNSWTDLAIDELIDILVNVEFPDPMDAHHGSSHIVGRLYKIHGPKLTEAQLSRLREFAFSPQADPDQHHAQRSLKCYLSVLSNDPDQFKDFWLAYHSPDVNWSSSWSAMTEAAGDLPTRDPEIIDRLIQVVERPFMFGPRYEAMVALGKIGQPAGQRAVEVIQASIYDSSDRVVAVRDRVLDRIQTPADDWSVCPRCFHGYVSGTGSNIRSTQSCGHCLGLGYVPRTE